MNEFSVIFCTVPNIESGEKIANLLVEQKLAACVNIVPGLRSIYRWEDKICDDCELLLVIKTRSSIFEQIKSSIKSLHPYSVPEIISIPIKDGDDNYLKWIDQNAVSD
jgi:periplasmic divalent cation tolerance protein